jgi:hypothetical protein
MLRQLAYKKQTGIFCDIDWFFNVNFNFIKKNIWNSKQYMYTVNKFREFLPQEPSHHFAMLRLKKITKNNEDAENTVMTHKCFLSGY